MNALLGPIDDDGRIPPTQQTRIAAFLMSAHGAQRVEAWHGDLEGVNSVVLHTHVGTYLTSHQLST